MFDTIDTGHACESDDPVCLSMLGYDIWWCRLSGTFRLFSNLYVFATHGFIYRYMLDSVDTLSQVNIYYKFMATCADDDTSMVGCYVASDERGMFPVTWMNEQKLEKSFIQVIVAQ